MSKAVGLIVSGYVVLNDRRALEDLLAHRQKLLDGLERVCGIDPRLLVTQIGEEIAVIQAGLERLDGKAPQAQPADRGEVLQSTVADVFTNIDNDATTPGPAGRATGTTDQLMQPPAPQADVELLAAQVTPASDQDGSQIKVIGLVVSVVSTGVAIPPLSAAPAEVGHLDPGSFDLCTPLSSQPVQQTGEGSKDTETPYSGIDAFKSLVSVWNDEPTKS